MSDCSRHSSQLCFIFEFATSRADEIIGNAGTRVAYSGRAKSYIIFEGVTSAADGRMSERNELTGPGIAGICLFISHLVAQICATLNVSFVL